MERGLDAKSELIFWQYRIVGWGVLLIMSDVSTLSERGDIRARDWSRWLDLSDSFSCAYYRKLIRVMIGDERARLLICQLYRVSYVILCQDPCFSCWLPPHPSAHEAHNVLLNQPISLSP
jgi:hypothetical protein